MPVYELNPMFVPVYKLNPMFVPIYKLNPMFLLVIGRYQKVFGGSIFTFTNLFAS